MTGPVRTRWTWPSSSLLPAALLVAECTWGGLLVNAIVNTSHGPHTRLTLYAFVLPMLAIVLVTTTIARIRSDRFDRVRGYAYLLTGVVGAAVTAGTVSRLSTGEDAWWRVAFVPWSVSGHAAGIETASCWFAAIVVWTRGVWVSARGVEFRAAVLSCVLGAAVFIGIFIGHAGHGHGVFRAATSSAGWELVLWFPLVVVAVALIREQELERAVLDRPASRPGIAWWSVLAVPTVAVVLLALFAALVAGPLGVLIGHGIADAVRGVMDAILFVVHWLSHLFGDWHVKQAPPPPRLPSQRGRSHPKAQKGSLGVWSIVLVVVLGLVLLVVLVLVIRRLSALLRGRRRPAGDPVDDGESDTVFSWGHLGRQLRGLLRRLLRRRRSSAVSAPSPAPEDVAALAPQDAASVRAAYRRMLRAADRAGRARRRSETPLELSGRLGTDVAGTSGPLYRLTVLYQDVRYGGANSSAGDLAVARDDAVLVSDALVATIPPDVPATTGPAPAPRHSRWPRRG